MVYDREGKKLWLVDETGAHRPIETWDEVAQRPRRADLPDWWVVAKDIDWRPPAGTLTGLPDGWTGKSLVSMNPNEADRADAGGSGGEGYKLGCGGKQQERYDTATGKYTGGGAGGGSGREGGGAAKTKSAPPKKDAPAKPLTTRTEYHKRPGRTARPGRKAIRPLLPASAWRTTCARLRHINMNPNWTSGAGSLEK